MSQTRLKKIFHENLQGELLRKTSLKAAELNIFINRFFSCFKSTIYSNNLIPTPIVLVLNQLETGTGEDCLDPNTLVGVLAQLKDDDANVFLVDYTGKRISDDTLDNIVVYDEDDAYNLSETHGLILFYIKQLAVRVIANGVYISSTENILTYKRSGVIRSTDRPPTQYRDIIQAHFEKELLKGKRLEYWDDKQTRTLKQRPEQHFRDQLLSYLKDNLTIDGIVEKEIPVALTDDKVDIRITDTANNSEYYFVEVKWMGKALSFSKVKDGQGKTIEIVKTIEVGEEGPNGGIYQLGIYLENETRAKCGSLVTYDARPNNKDIDWTKPESEWHNKIDKPPMTLFIESDSASKEAKKRAQEDKKQRKNKGS